MGHEKNTSEKGGPDARNSPLWIRLCDMSKLIIIFLQIWNVHYLTDVHY